VELVFRDRYALGPGGRLALEDYARALTRARAAEAAAVPDDPGRVSGVHLCTPLDPPRGTLLEDLEAFAREMTEETGEGLGWS
jgi:hypothetical protein